MIFVISYVDVMKALRSTDVLTYLLSNPLNKIRNPYIMAIAVIFIGLLMRTSISDAPAQAALLSTMFLPILLARGASLGTAASAILLPLIICWGPADMNNITATKIMGIDVNMTELFVEVHVPIVIVTFILFSLIFPLAARMFDSKSTEIIAKTTTTFEKPNVPLIYSILPLLPMISMVLFSPLFISSISIDIVPACMLSLAVSTIIVLVKTRKFENISLILNSFTNSFGDNLKRLGMTVLFALSFASSLNKIGGMQIIANAIMDMQIPSILLVLIISLLGAVISTIVGSFFGALSITLPLANSMVPATGLSEAVICVLIIIASGVGAISTPISPLVLTVADRCDIDVITLIKRSAPIGWVTLVITAIISTIIF